MFLAHFRSDILMFRIVRLTATISFSDNFYGYSINPFARSEPFQQHCKALLYNFELSESAVKACLD